MPDLVLPANIFEEIVATAYATDVATNLSSG